MKFISKDLALKLKEKGFDKPCFGYYYIETPTGMNEGEIVHNKCNTRGAIYKDCLYSSNYDYYFDAHLVNKVDAPTTEQVLEWLREKDVYIWIEPYNTFIIENRLAFQWNITLGKSFKSKDQFDKDTLYTHIHLDIEHWKENYNDACIAGIEYVINNLI